MDNQVEDEHHRFPRRKDNGKLSLNKFHSVEPQNIVSTIRQAEKRISSLNQDRLRIADKLQQRMLDRDLAKIYYWRSRDRVGTLTWYKKHEIRNLQQWIKDKERRGTDSPNKQKNDPAVKNIRCRINRGKCNLATERKILLEIKKAQAVVENAEIEETYADRLKIVSRDLEWLMREDAVYKFNTTTEILDKKMAEKTAEIEAAKLQNELEKIIRREDEMRSYILELKARVL